MTPREGITADMLAILSQPTPPEEVKQRQGARQHDGQCGKPCRLPHLMLDYIDARFVMERLDEIGPENWQDQFVDRAEGSVRCGISVLVEGEWVTKWDVGTESDIESEKGSYSDAFKRAAVKWGIGRDLYGHGPSRPKQAPVQAQPGRVVQMPRPVAPTVPPEIEEPEYLAATFHAPVGRPQGHGAADPHGDGGFCPSHGLAWVLRPGGVAKATNKAYGPFWACPSTDKPFCKERPSPAWIEAVG